MSLFGSGLAIWSLGCATSAAPPAEDRLSLARLKAGPSLYETGRFGTVPLSNGGLTIDRGSIDPHQSRVVPASAARASSARAIGTGRRAPGKRKPRLHVDP